MTSIKYYDPILLLSPVVTAQYETVAHSQTRWCRDGAARFRVPAELRHTAVYDVGVFKEMYRYTQPSIIKLIIYNVQYIYVLYHRGDKCMCIHINIPVIKI